MQVSHETIYRTLFVQSRNVFKQENAAIFAARPRDAPPAPDGGGNDGLLSRCYFDS